MFYGGSPCADIQRWTLHSSSGYRLVQLDAETYAPESSGATAATSTTAQCFCPVHDNDNTAPGRPSTAAATPNIDDQQPLQAVAGEWRTAALFGRPEHDPLDIRLVVHEFNQTQQGEKWRSGGAHQPGTVMFRY